MIGGMRSILAGARKYATLPVKRPPNSTNARPASTPATHTENEPGNVPANVSTGSGPPAPQSRGRVSRWTQLIEDYHEPPPPQTPFVIINPAAGGGVGERRGSRLVKRLTQRYPNLGWGLSSPARPLTLLAGAALSAGYTRLVGVGGDGTHHQILQAIVAAGITTRVEYAHFPAGTGNDWARAQSIPHDLDAWLAHYHRRNLKPHPVGYVTFRVSPDGPRRTAYFLNVVGMAYDAETVRHADELPPRARPRYVRAVFKTLNRFVAPKIMATYHPSAGNASRQFHDYVQTVHLGLNPYSGGGMRFVPHANPERGDLALTIMRPLSVPRLLTQSYRLYTGTVARLPEVTTDHVSRFAVTGVEGSLEVEADGEWLGYGPVEVGVLGEGLRVVGFEKGVFAGVLYNTRAFRKVYLKIMRFLYLWA